MSESAPFTLTHYRVTALASAPGAWGTTSERRRVLPLPVTAAALEGARILYLRAPSKEFTATETEAIVAFVKGGGSLLLVLDEERRQSLEKTGVNNLISPFGMRLTPDTEYLHNNGGVAKAGEINKADREVPFSGGRAVESGTAFAFQWLSR